MPVHQTCKGCAAKDHIRDDHSRPAPGTTIVLVPQAVGTAMMSEQHEREQKRRARDAARAAAEEEARRADDHAGDPGP